MNPDELDEKRIRSIRALSKDLYARLVAERYGTSGWSATGLAKDCIEYAEAFERAWDRTEMADHHKTQHYLT